MTYCHYLGTHFLQALAQLYLMLIQIGVLQWFAKLWEIDTEDYWGYITNCGTEGNLHGILVGRENHPDGTQDFCSFLVCLQQAVA